VLSEQIDAAGRFAARLRGHAEQLCKGRRVQSVTATL
jgi:hypothetical protein